ncbi:MAG TPA: peptidoglycan-binding protein [Solirubrobacteraceae bacterium]|nr:peptidoglycan-binding protein [Solirubrobacteraceae bacterium]
MPGYQLDLAAPDPWVASLERSRARRARAARRTHGRHAAACASAAPLALHGARSDARDLALNELWELSLGRSRARRRAAELRFVPAGTRAKRLSLGALAALSVGPAATLAEGGSAAASPAPSTPEPPATSEHGVVLSGESEGRPVASLQRSLGAVKVDGVYGPETEAAVRKFQESRGLSVDGVAGPQTDSALRTRAATTATLVGFHASVPGEPASSSESSGAEAASANAASGSEGAAGGAETGAIKRLQGALHLPVDGEFGPETLAAIERLQARQGISVDGVVGPQTWKAIGVSAETTLTPPPSALPPEPEPEAPAEGASTAGGNGGTSAEPVAVAAASGGSGEAAAPAHEAPAQSAPSEESHEGSSEQAPSSAPSSSGGGEGTIGRVIAAGNEIATRPYVYGGGHGSFSSSGYDCSGSVSYALHGGGLLNSPQDSTGLESYGESGPGKHITIYANSEHAFMVVNGKRFDTVAQAENGSRWSSSTTSTSGYVVRHPSGY